MDIVWLKRDVRLHDHGPLHSTTISTADVCVLYLYEPDQLTEPTVHGSHISLINEGLIDLDQQLQVRSGEGPCSTRDSTGSVSVSDYQFQSLTVCHGNAVPTLQHIHSQYTIKRLLCHEETGHYASYQRDRQVRKWCREQGVEIVEFNQTGVTRRLKDRDGFAKRLDHFLNQPEYATINVHQLRLRVKQLEIDILVESHDIPHSDAALVPANQLSQPFVRTTKRPLLDELWEIPEVHRTDRASRQQGGERLALKALQSFLQNRSKLYQTGISSPLSAWSSCSRLSIFLSWGHISLRRVYQSTRQRQEELKVIAGTGLWRKSLASFQSRVHWRSHFIQKLESDPMYEKRDVHPSYQQLRRQPEDWNEDYYQAWATGRTGYPFVDACMRCLLQMGWINFRMRAMLVSFATYNLWLDWKRIAPHLARVFCDYEPGIHYPQLQMQAGTTGINAMRVYNVVKQGQDQDPDGVFVKRYVPELRSVPNKFIHEPWKLMKGQQQLNIRGSNTSGANVNSYPEPIVDAQESARIAKAKVHAIRKKSSTLEIAQQVYQKHGSRSFRGSDDAKKRSLPVPKTPPVKNQPRISSFLTTASTQQQDKRSTAKAPLENARNKRQRTLSSNAPSKSVSSSGQKRKEQRPLVAAFQAKKVLPQPVTWVCPTCTFVNDKPFGLVCSMCHTNRRDSS